MTDVTLDGGGARGSGEFENIYLDEGGRFYIGGVDPPAGQVLATASDGTLMYSDNDYLANEIHNTDSTQVVKCEASDIRVTGTLNLPSTTPPMIDGIPPAALSVLSTDSSNNLVWADSAAVVASDHIISPNGSTSVTCLNGGGVVFVSTAINIPPQPFVIDGVQGLAGEFITVDVGGVMRWVDVGGVVDYTGAGNIEVDATNRVISTKDAVTFPLSVTTPRLEGLSLLTVGSDSGTADQVLGKGHDNTLQWLTPAGGTGGSSYEPVGGSNITVTLDSPNQDDALISLNSSVSISSLTVAAGIDADTVYTNILAAQAATITGANIRDFNFSGIAGGIPKLFISNAPPGGTGSSVVSVTPTGVVSFAALGAGSIPISGRNIEVLPNNPVSGEYTINLFTNITEGLNLLHANTQITSPSGHFDTLRCNISASIRDLNLFTVGTIGPRLFVNGAPGTTSKNILVGDATGGIAWEPLVNIDKVSEVTFGAGSALYNSIARWPVGSEHVILNPANQSTLPAAFYLLPATVSTNFSGSVRFSSTTFINTSSGYLLIGVTATSGTLLRGRVIIHAKVVGQSPSSPYSIVNPVTTVIPFTTANAIKSLRFAASGGAYGYLPSGEFSVIATYINPGVIDLEITLFTNSPPNTLANYLSGGALNQNGLA